MTHNNWSRIQKFERKVKCSFKRFVGLCISMDDEILSRLMNFKVLTLAKNLETAALSKWQQRVSHCPFITSPSKINVKTPLLAKVFAKFNNSQKTKCNLGNNKSTNSAHHLQTVHSLPIPSSIHLLEELERDSPPLSTNVSRASILKFKERRISQYLTLVFNNLKLSL